MKKMFFAVLGLIVVCGLVGTPKAIAQNKSQPPTVNQCWAMYFTGLVACEAQYDRDIAGQHNSNTYLGLGYGPNGAYSTPMAAWDRCRDTCDYLLDECLLIAV